MYYRVRHLTQYAYSSSVSLSHNQHRLIPRNLSNQRVYATTIAILPLPASIKTWQDSFGNITEFFSIEQGHRSMSIESRCEVDRGRSEVNCESHRSWENIVAISGSPKSSDDLQSQCFVFDSKYVRKSKAILDYARPSFWSGVGIIESALHLTRRIYSEFEYDSTATQISTPILDVLRGRRGVCQDFAHLQVACFRSLGIPARYVSGYLLTQAPPGKERLIGSDASHAWVAVYIGNGEWLDLDPTNNVIPHVEHITIGWGRDYGDVCPLQGVTVGGGNTSLSVSVDVIPTEQVESPSGGNPPRFL